VERKAHLLEAPPQKDGARGIHLLGQQALVASHDGHLYPPLAKPVARLDPENPPADDNQVFRLLGPSDHGLRIGRGVKRENPFEIVSRHLRDDGMAPCGQQEPIVGIGLPVGCHNGFLGRPNIDDFRGEVDLDPVLLVPGTVMQGHGLEGLFPGQVFGQGGPVVVEMALAGEHPDFRFRVEFPDGLRSGVARRPAAHDHITAHFFPFVTCT